MVDVTVDVSFTNQLELT